MDAFNTARHLGLSLLLLTISLAAPVAAQIPAAGTGSGMGSGRAHSIRGAVRMFSGGGPAANIRVVLAVFPELAVATAITSDGGFFEFMNVPDGEYQILIQEALYGSVCEPLTVRAGSVHEIQVYLRSANSAPSGPAGSMVSVRELLRPRRAQEAMRKGLHLLYRKSDYFGSLKQFERAIQEDPGYYEAYAQMGVAQMHLQDSVSAEAALRKSIELSEGKHADACFLLASLLSSIGRYAEAEALARQAIGIDSKRWQAHSELARALVELQRTTEAEESAATAVQLQPENAALRLLLADIHLALKNDAALLDDLENYLRLAPTGAMAAQARETQARIERALEQAPTAGAAAHEDTRH
jgi:Tfp pilus assembly protein PilF